MPTTKDKAKEFFSELRVAFLEMTVFFLLFCSLAALFVFLVSAIGG